MKKEAAMKTMSLSLSLAIVLMSPGLNCWATLSETVNVPRASVDVVPVDSFNNALVPETNFSFKDADVSVAETVTQDAVQLKATDGIEAEKTAERSFKNVNPVATSGITQNQARGFKETLAHHAARGIQAIQKFHQAVLNHIAGWSNLFDGSRFHPALALAGDAGYVPQAASSLREAKNLYLEEASANGVDNGSTVEAAVPAPNAPSNLKTQIDAAVSSAQTISFMIKKMGVYASVQNVVSDLKKNPSSVDAEALNGLLMTAQSALADTLSLIPAINQIATQDLREPDIQAEISKLRGALQTAIQDLKDMSLATGEVASALVANKSSAGDIAAWKNLSNDYQKQALALNIALQKLGPQSSAQTKTPPSSSSSDTNRLIFGIGWLVLLVAASHMASLAVFGVIMGAAIGAAMTPKGEDGSINMLMGSILGLFIGAMFAPAAAHAATLAAAHVVAGSAHAALKAFGGGVIGAFIGAIAGGGIGIFLGLRSGDSGSEAGAGLAVALGAIVGAGIGGVIGAILGATILAAFL